MHIVWFKRDLRIQDHAALTAACAQGAVLPMYCWDPSVWCSGDYATQHLRFVEECLQSLRQALQTLGLTLWESPLGIIETLQLLKQQHAIDGLYSHEETGTHSSYQLDLAVGAWCKMHQVAWHEYPQHGVVRRLRHRDDWAKRWEQHMRAAQSPIPVAPKLARLPSLLAMPWEMRPIALPQADKPLRQRGGREAANRCMQTFLNGRASRYLGGISSPISATHAGSRLSPYLTWGVLSMREVMQALQQTKLRLQEQPASYPQGLLSGLLQFEQRLHWHCHFIQKLESEPRIEHHNLHPAFDGMRDANYSTDQQQQRLQAWQSGCTGWPLVDACMAMLRQTGWINFRMRALLMSTASYLLWLHWRETGLHLAREFLDYEPGIHWPQVQMQSGTTGINTLRIYNPVKQAKDQDPKGVFVRRWLPALRNVPNAWIFQPWLMPANLQADYGCVIGVDYPAPMVEIDEALRNARYRFASVVHNASHQAITAQIVQTHASRKSSVKGTRQKRLGTQQRTHNAQQKSLF